MRKLIADETGMTMALSIMMIVIVGVMGAGLLTFTMRDLDVVVESNRGQTASEMADAGLEAAKTQLSSVDANPLHYDGLEDTSVPGDEESNWAEDDTPKELAFNGYQITAGIRYLRPSLNATEAAEMDRAPEVLPADAVDGSDPDADPDYAKNRHYFRVTVQGSANGALRRFQAILKTENFQLPVGYYSTRDIDIDGTATKVHNVSLFAERYIRDLEADKKTGATVQCGTLCGRDQAYGNWKYYPDATANPNDGTPNPHNSTPRATDHAGAAALGEAGTPGCPPSPTSGISYSSADDDKQKSRTAVTGTQSYGLRDFDRDSDFTCPGPASSSDPGFSNTWDGRNTGTAQPTNVVTFPFEARDEVADNTLLDNLKARAEAQGRYLRVNNGTGNTRIVIEDSVGLNTPLEAVYPDTLGLDQVMFIEFTGSVKGKVEYKAGNHMDPPREGTIVVVNGDMDTSSSAAGFKGVILVRDGVNPGRAPGTTSNTCPNATQVACFDNGGSLDIDGYVNVEGDLFLRGSVGGILPGELLNGVPGAVSVNLWSWRECYNTSCS